MAPVGKGEVPTLPSPFLPLPPTPEGGGEASGSPGHRSSVCCGSQETNTPSHTHTSPSGSPLKPALYRRGGGRVAGRRLRLRGASDVPEVTSQSASPRGARIHDPRPRTPPCPRPLPRTAPSDVNVSNPNKPLPQEVLPPPPPAPGQRPPERPSYDPHPRRQGARFHCQPGHSGAREAGVQGRGAVWQAMARRVGRGLQGKCSKRLLQLCPDPEAAGGGRKAGVGRARP